MEFYRRVISSMLASKRVATGDSVLVVCGAEWDRANFLALGFDEVTISNVVDLSEEDTAPYRRARADAESLPFPDGSFDVVAVHGGLHHCYSPHRAMLEMHRVARKAVVVVESRDSLAMRLAVRAGLTDDYEIETTNRGGAGGGTIPNFVYRWTEAEVRKAVASFEPRHRPEVDFFYGLLLPDQRLAEARRDAARIAVRMLKPLAMVIQALFPRQGNRFGWIVWKDRPKLHSWAETRQAPVPGNSRKQQGLRAA